MYSKGDSPWNKGKILPEKMRKSISIGKTGVRFQQPHKDRISATQKRRWESIKQPLCSQCYSRQSTTNPLFKALMPAVSEHPLMLCESHLIDQFFSLSPEQKKEVQILE